MIRNLVYATPDGSAIDLELDHPVYGWIPFTASQHDTEEHGRDIYAAAVGGQFGPIAPYVEPEPLPPVVPHAVTRRQGRLALLEAGKLAAVEQAIEAIEDPLARQAAQIEYEADAWERSNAFLIGMWAQLGGTESELDALFILASEK